MIRKSVSPSGENDGSVCHLRAFGEWTRKRQEEGCPGSFSVPRASPAESGPRSSEAKGSVVAAQSKRASWGKKGRAGGAKTAGRGGAVGAEPTPPGPWGDRSPGRAAWGAGPGVCVSPGSPGQPLPIPRFVFPALWFPNLFGLKFVSNFFFFPGVIETKPLNACSFLREIKGDFKQEDHRSQNRAWGAGWRGGSAAGAPLARLAAADCPLRGDGPA